MGVRFDRFPEGTFYGWGNVAGLPPPLNEGMSFFRAALERKVITVPGKDTILGATIVGDHAGDILVEYVAAMKHGFGMNKILGTIHTYPTLGEANKYAAGVWKRNHQPKKLLEWVAKFHDWERR
jgi:hypothetical protein